jgi:hypothetical protein
MKEYLNFVFLTLVVIWFVGAITWSRLKRFLQFSDSSNWPIILATVEEVKVQPHYGRSSTTYCAEVLYSYQVGGEYYSGRYAADSFVEEDANAVVREHPKGSTLQIQVSPANPKRSVVI